MWGQLLSRQPPGTVKDADTDQLLRHLRNFDAAAHHMLFCLNEVNAHAGKTQLLLLTNRLVNIAHCRLPHEDNINIWNLKNM